MGAIEHPPIVTVPGVPDHVLYTWLAMAVLIVLSFVATRHLELVPRGLQNFVEVVLEQVLALLDDVIGHAGRRYLPLIATLGLFILVSNLLGLIPGFIAPTGNLNTTAACALIVFISYHVIGARKVGVIPYLKHFAGPMPILAPLMVPIELISHLARVLSLTIRLYANIFAGDMVTWVFFSLVPVGIPIAFLGLHLGVSILQTYIFVLLTTVYLQGAVADEH